MSCNSNMHSLSFLKSKKTAKLKIFGLLLEVQRLMPQFQLSCFALSITRRASSCKAWLPSPTLTPWAHTRMPHLLQKRPNPMQSVGLTEFSWHKPQAHPVERTHTHKLKLFFLPTRTSLFSSWLSFCLTPWGSPFVKINPATFPPQIS